MKKRTGFPEIAEAVLGILIYLIPIVCGIYILSWAGRAYHEGYNLFAEESLDSPATAHSELITVSESEADSALAVGRILEKQNLVSSGVTFAIKARLAGYSDKFLPGSFLLSSDMTMVQMMEKLSREPTAEKADPASGGEETAGAEDSQTGGKKKENKDVWGQY